MRRPATIGTLAILAVVLLSPAPRAGAADVATRQLETLAFSPDAVRFQARDSAADGGIVVTLPGCERLAAPGQPDLPSRIVWVELGAGETLRGVRAAATATVTLGTHRIAPVAGEASFADRAGGGWATVGYEGFLRGRRLAAVLVHPFRWQPDTGELELARAIEVELELADAAPGDRALERHRIVPEIERRLDRALGGRLDAAPAPVTAAGPAARAAAATDGGPAAPGPYQPTFRPTPDGSPVEYVIVTADSLAGEFERLAAWKTRKGVQAVVRSVEWIEATYPSGADRAERIRFFIQDAYQNWGTLFVLLGGDTELIPARYVESILLNGESIPADYYYACLDGDWNADGDSRFGEGSSILGPGDAADLLFDVSVGRAPVTTVAETQVFIDKTLAYELRAPDAGSYPASILALAEFPWIFELCDDVLPPWFEIRRLYVDSAQYPGSDELTRASALAAINQGYGIVQHNGHGYRNTMSVGEGTLVNADIAGLTNGDRTSVVLANNCSSAAIDFNAIGEAWLHNPNGGAVAYIGTSRRSWQIPADVYQLDWYDRVFVDSVSTVALATDVARLSLIPNAEPDNATRWNLMATLVLGDPELDIYLNAVAPLEVAHADTVELGPLPYEVTVSSGGEPVADATVTLRREGEAYARASTDASGVASLAFAPQTAGEATLTVHRTHYAVYEAVIQVESTASPYPFVAAVTIDDDDQGESNGDGDGLADAGETIELVLTIENGGGAAATGLEATITAEDSLGVVTITTDSVVHGTIDPGGSSTGNGAFVIAIDPSAPEAYQPVIVVAIDSNEGNWEDVTVLPLRRPFLEHERHTIDDAPPRGNGNGAVEPGETIWYTITLRNRGQHDLPAVACTLRTLGSDSLPHPLVTVTDSLADFDPIDVGASVTGDRFEFQLDAGADPASLLLGVTFGMAPYAPLVQLLDVMPPGAADTLQAFGSPTSITLRWSPPGDDDVLGYEVSRGDGPSGPFTRLNPDLLRGGAVYEDRDLPALTRFYYRIVTRDSSYNASPVSEVVSGTTNPPLHPGWPVSVGQQSSSSVTAVDFDRSHRLELFVGAEMQYAYHHDATEVRNGDDSTITNGPYSLRGYDALKGFSATQAIGDLERDGDPEIANVGFTLAQDSLFVWDHEGQVIDGFPKWLMDDFNFASPAMADLDRDGDLEIVVWAGKGGRLFAWHHDGTEVADGDANPDTDGVLYRVFSTSFNFASPAVGNLDMDDSLEVVVAVNINSADSTGAVYAVNLDGSLVDGWPFLTGEPGFPSQVSSSPALGDVDGDGDLEVVVAAEREGGRVYVLEHDGTVHPGWPKPAPAGTDVRLPSPVLCDFEHDGQLEIVYADTDGYLRVWDQTGTVRPGFFNLRFSTVSPQATESTPAVADIDGDGQLEILVGDETGRLHGYNDDGSPVDGFPIQLGGEIRSTPAIWDFDGDGLVEVAVLANDTQLRVWDLTGAFDPALAAWTSFRHDPMNTGAYATPIVQIGVDDPAGGDLAVVPLAAATLGVPAPNPFNPRTRITFEVRGDDGAARHVRLGIYDVHGRLVRRLVDGPVESGRHTLIWDGASDRGGRGAASGTYFVRLRAGDVETTRKLTLLR